MRLLSSKRSKSRVHQITSHLNRDLAGLYAKSVLGLKANGEYPALVHEDVDVLLSLATARERLRDAAVEDGEQDVAPTLAGIIDEIQDKLARSRNPNIRLGLSRILTRLAAASVQLSTMPGPEARDVENVVIPSELLVQARQNLFPAERIQVISGRRIGRTVYLETATDVTGEHSNGHVKADDRKLSDARLDTARNGTFLAMYLHSHVGEGPAATVPIPADTRQHEHWMHQFWPLLIGATMVRDGYLRLFGDAIERKQVAVTIEGTGIERIAQQEPDEPGLLYNASGVLPSESKETVNPLQQEKPEEQYVTREDLQELQRGIKDTVRSFLDFFVNYTLEMDGHPKKRRATTPGTEHRAR